MTAQFSYSTGPLDAGRFPDLARFFAVWDHSRGGRFAPSWSEFDFLSYPAEQIRRMYVLDVRRDPLGFYYRFLGSDVVEAEGKDYTGWSVDDLPNLGDALSVRTQFEAFIADPKPTFFVISDNVEPALSETIYGGVRVPISEDGVSVDKVLCMAQFDNGAQKTRKQLRKLFDDNGLQQYHEKWHWDN